MITKYTRTKYGPSEIVSYRGLNIMPLPRGGYHIEGLGYFETADDATAAIDGELDDAWAPWVPREIK